MRRLIVIVALAGGTFATVYLASSADMTTLAANRVATCPVRVSDECRQQYPSLSRYERLRFGVNRTVQADGGVQFIVPRSSGPVGQAVRDCVEVIDWNDCDLDTCATHPGVCQSFDAGNPFTRVRTAAKHVIPDCRGSDGGWVDNHDPVDCLRRTEDGGTRWAGCNVMPKNQSVGTKCLNAPTGVVFAGERIEESL